MKQRGWVRATFPFVARRQRRGLAGRLAVVSLVFISGCGGDMIAPGGGGGLTFKRADGSEIEFSDDRRVYCAPFDESAPAPAVHVAVGAPRPSQGPYWTLVADARIEEGDAVAFPSLETDIFVYDEADRGNELSSDTEETTGRIVFHELACERGGVVHFTLNASLGSEFGDRAGIRVQGEFRATVTRLAAPATSRAEASGLSEIRPLPRCTRSSSPASVSG
jgi:hypothetical protein